MSFFFSSRRRHTRFDCDWSSDVCSSDLDGADHERYRRRVLHRRASSGHGQWKRPWRTQASGLTVSVEDWGEASTISTVVGAKTALEFAGNPLMLKSMLPPKPPDRVTVTVYVTA